MMKQYDFDLKIAHQFAQLALNCIHQKYPHVHRYFLKQDQDLILPDQLYPVFCGCLDWHSAVHSHWMLIRLIREFPNAAFSSIAREKIALNFTSEKIAKEIEYLKSNPQFEYPYGLAWFLQLIAELTEWEDTEGREWLNLLQPLGNIAVENIQTELHILSYPNRTGTHQQTAFSLSLIWDFATLTDDQSLLNLISNIANIFYLRDQNYPLSLEPLGCDFLSPTLAEADLMGRILPSEGFAEWLSLFLPQIPTTGDTDWLKPVCLNHPEDYQQSHLDGLNLSRAWMLEGIVAALPPEDQRIPSLQAVADLHRQAGLNPLSATEYSGSHWLGSFAVYLATHRGFS